MIGNGKFDKSYGTCKDVSLALQGLQITSDFFPLELGSNDVILGMNWLCTLDDTCVN